MTFSALIAADRSVTETSDAQVLVGVVDIVRNGVSRHFVLLCIILGLAAIAAPALVVGLDLASMQSVSQFVDTAVKAVALTIGGVWTLNRFYTHRVDEVRLDVTLESHYITTDAKAPDAGGLVIFRIDVLNTGRVILPSFGRTLEVRSVTPADGAVETERLYRWPATGTHPGGAVEPGSWIGLSDAFVVENKPLALRYYLEIEFVDGRTWTWHKMLPTAE